MDPFSIIVGVGSLIDLSLKLGKYLKDVHDSIAAFEEDVGQLLNEIQNLNSVNKSIEQLFRTETFGAAELSGSSIPPQEREARGNIVKILKECSQTVKRLQNVLDTVTGKNGSKVTGLRDGIKKQLRKQAKEGELEQIRVKLSSHRDDLNIFLTLLSL